MKLGYIDPELYADATQEEPQAPAYRPKFQRAISWAEAERARDPKHYESASYSISWDGASWTVKRLAWKGVADLTCGIVPSSDHARRYMDWLVSNDKKIHQLAFEGNSDLILLLMRGMVDTR